MTIIISVSVLLLASLLPHLTFTAHVNVGIVNGTEAEPHSRPYMVSIQKNRQHICGGFLISNQFLLTAAHCWNQKEVLTVVVGAHDLRNIENSDRFDVNSYIPHPDYIPCLNQNDIMLMRLEEKVKANNSVKWIELPLDGEEMGTNSVCSVAGWGRLKTKGPTSDLLMEANVYIMNNTECSYKWGETYSLSQMMCTHGRGGSCLFDSGGPLVYGNTAVGITSFGSAEMCNSPKYPNVYIKISQYREWIDNMIRKSEFSY